MREIIGNTTATPTSYLDWNQIKNKPIILTEEQIRAIIQEMLAESNIPSAAIVTIANEILHVSSNWRISVADEVLSVISDKAVTVNNEILYVQ